MAQFYDYHAYGENGETIKDGTIVLYSGLPVDDDERATVIMEAICEDVGEDVFESKVVGVVV